MSQTQQEKGKNMSNLFDLMGLNEEDSFDERKVQEIQRLLKTVLPVVVGKALLDTHTDPDDALPVLQALIAEMKLRIPQTNPRQARANLTEINAGGMPALFAQDNTQQSVNVTAIAPTPQANRPQPTQSVTDPIILELMALGDPDLVQNLLDTAKGLQQLADDDRYGRIKAMTQIINGTTPVEPDGSLTAIREAGQRHESEVTRLQDRIRKLEAELVTERSKLTKANRDQTDAVRAAQDAKDSQHSRDLQTQARRHDGELLQLRQDFRSATQANLDDASAAFEGLDALKPGMFGSSSRDERDAVLKVIDRIIMRNSGVSRLNSPTTATPAP